MYKVKTLKVGDIPQEMKLRHITVHREWGNGECVIGKTTLPNWGEKQLKTAYEPSLNSDKFPTPWVCLLLPLKQIFTGSVNVGARLHPKHLKKQIQNHTRLKVEKIE